MITMKAHEDTRQIQIQIADDTEVEPDEDFEIVLLHEITRERLPGYDTSCRVTITEHYETANVLGFSHRVHKVRRNDKVATLSLERKNGFNEMQCMVKTSSKHPILQECDHIAEAKKDYEFLQRIIDFPQNVSVIQVDIELKYTLASAES